MSSPRKLTQTVREFGRVAYPINDIAQNESPAQIKFVILFATAEPTVIVRCCHNVERSRHAANGSEHACTIVFAHEEAIPGCPRKRYEYNTIPDM
eukprot:scaffold2974_cov181-Amphora_coffeaeformis.AAC.22